MKIELRQQQLTALIEHLGALVARYEIEAAAYASIGTAGREMAEGRLADIREAKALQEYLLRQ